ncbi:receptor-interacting serine/threonine-protein kinase 2 [Gouania willdenowi]|uniref:Receptor-interacting serine/threonine-protein kinase 2 n=1 Tax=Gouania willdenowi TaxID=441366 RepID=A0A8C5DGV0_GOUWI|nr:receptor-interacting serine/threonine-protein kinase 2 [Gouania willdenowi]
MNRTAAPGCMDTGCLSSTLPEIPYQKLTDLYYLNKGGFAQVFKAQHSDWRTTVAVKCLRLDGPLGNRERNSLLKEAEILHKSRFNHVIQVLGVCNQPEFFCIVTEFMSNGSLDMLLHEKDTYPVVAWSLRVRILYEIALGVNFLHNMNPPLLHHDLKLQNILLDAEYHVKVAGFGLAKWHRLSGGGESSSKPCENEGTGFYMPPEEYKAFMKHDMYSYAIVMWEVLSRQNPFEEETNVCGARPDTSLSTLPSSIPSRETLVSIMTQGWTPNHNQRPSFQQCLIKMEPVVRSFNDIDFLEGVLEIKRSEMQKSYCVSAPNEKTNVLSAEETRKMRKESVIPWPESCPSEHSSTSSQDTEMSQPCMLTSIIPPDISKLSLPPSFLDPPGPLMDEQSAASTNGFPSSKLNNLNEPDVTKCEKRVEESTLIAMQKPHPQPTEYPFALQPDSPSQGPCSSWIKARRENIVAQMTDACLNQILDALLARSLLMHEDYELVSNKPTRTAKVRQLVDTCYKQDEEFCYVVVHKLHINKQKGLVPYPPEVMSGTSLSPLSLSLNISRN